MPHRSALREIRGVFLLERVGEHISRKITSEGWGKGTVESLARHVQRKHLTDRGYPASNLWRMSQFVERYRGLPKLATLVRELSWTHNLLIMSRSLESVAWRENPIEERFGAVEAAVAECCKHLGSA